MRASVISSALVAALVGYGSTIALVLSAATAVGASPTQTASWVLAVCLAKAIGSALLSITTRVPVVLAWSTPGAALIAATQGVTLAEAVAAFVLAGLLIALTGVIKPLGRAVALIPDGVAAGMLAGVLLPFCLKGAGAAQALPALVLPMIAVFVLVRLKNPALAVLAALGLGLALAFTLGGAAFPSLTLPAPSLTFIAPDQRLDVLFGLGLPLYLVTMASQNLPRCAPMATRPPCRRDWSQPGFYPQSLGCLARTPPPWRPLRRPSAWGQTPTPMQPSAGKRAWSMPGSGQHLASSALPFWRSWRPCRPR